jgi:hypothetical protein
MKVRRAGWSRVAVMMAPILIVVAMTGSQAEASAIVLVNKTDSQVDFRIFQGNYQIVSRDLPPGETASVPTSAPLAVTGVINEGHQQFQSGPIYISQSPADVGTTVFESDGTFDVQLVKAPGTTPGAITLQNSSADTVEFEISRKGQVLAIISVDPGNSASFPTDPQYCVDAIANGNAVPAADVDGPNAVVQAIPEKNAGQNGSGLSLRVR